MLQKRLGLAALAVASSAFAIACEGNSSSAGALPEAPTGTPGSSGSSGAPDGDGGVLPDGSPVGSANTILGLTPSGEIVRIGLGAGGTDTRLGFPKFNGVEVRTVGAIARGPGGLVGLDRGKKAGSSLVHIDAQSLEMTPFANDFGVRVPGKDALGFGGGAYYGTDQFGPVFSLTVDGVWHDYRVRQANSETDPIQCSTPEDLVWMGGLLAAGSCAHPDGLDKPGNGFYVWEYVLGMPGTTGQGGTSTDKVVRYKSPERILGLGVGTGLVATSAQGNLLVLSGTEFVVERKLAMEIDDLE